MNARAAILARLARVVRQGQGKRAKSRRIVGVIHSHKRNRSNDLEETSSLAPLDDALAAGRFQVDAELRGFVVGAERSHHGAVEGALTRDVSAVDRRRA